MHRGCDCESPCEVEAVVNIVPQIFAKERRWKRYSQISRPKAACSVIGGKLDLNKNYWVLYTILCCRKMYTKTWICGFGRNIICHIHIFINLALNEIFCAFFVSCNDIKMGCNMWLEEKLKPWFFEHSFSYSNWIHVIIRFCTYPYVIYSHAQL